MNTTTAKMNAIKELIGYEPTKAELIGLAIRGLVNTRGMSVPAATDAVLGCGTFAKLASELHDQFNAAN